MLLGHLFPNKERIQDSGEAIWFGSLKNILFSLTEKAIGFQGGCRGLTHGGSVPRCVHGSSVHGPLK